MPCGCRACHFGARAAVCSQRPALRLGRSAAIRRTGARRPRAVRGRGVLATPWAGRAGHGPRRGPPPAPRACPQPGARGLGPGLPGRLAAPGGRRQAPFRGLAAGAGGPEPQHCRDGPMARVRDFSAAQTDAPRGRCALRSAHSVCGPSGSSRTSWQCQTGLGTRPTATPPAAVSL